MSLPVNYSSFSLEAGVDEAGRGCLAGPVVAAAVIFPPDFTHALLNDSKKLSHTQRMNLRPVVLENALAWGIGVISAPRIDQINILNATFEAMHQAISGLAISPEFLAIDGNRFRTYPSISHACLVKGDSRFLNIAGASILAKTYRDELMEQLHREFPQYGWSNNKGYPTADHRKAIAQWGVTAYHRKSFNLLPAPTLFD
ncbi:MAG: ribonuclease HII [Bacteroidia bacterium]|nr:ribonuclease HII [Bacteroidia bacterium]